MSQNLHQQSSLVGQGFNTEEAEVLYQVQNILLSSGQLQSFGSLAKSLGVNHPQCAVQQTTNLPVKKPSAKIQHKTSLLDNSQSSVVSVEFVDIEDHISDVSPVDGTTNGNTQGKC